MVFPLSGLQVKFQGRILNMNYLHATEERNPMTIYNVRVCGIGDVLLYENDHVFQNRRNNYFEFTVEANGKRATVPRSKRTFFEINDIRPLDEDEIEYCDEAVAVAA